MKLLVVLAVVAAATAAVPNGKSGVVTLLDYYKSFSGNDRIIDGSAAQSGQFPWQVAVNFIVNGQGYFCGGSLISNQWVLTAAHCADGASSFTLRLGALKSSGSETGTVTVQTTTAVVHSGYNSYLNNDVALIKMNEPVTFTDRIQPIRLPSRGSSLGTGAQIRVSGWGKTSDSSSSISSTLNYVDLTTISNTQCANYYGSATVVSSTLCAVGNPQHSTCNGDSGGPLVTIDSNNVATHHGVVSFVSSAGCSSGAPSGYVRTESMLSWISQQTGLDV